MVSLSTVATLGLITAAVLGFYKLGGASGIGSRIGGGFSSLFNSFTSSINPVQAAIDENNANNPALNPLLVAQARLEEATSLDPNLAADRFVDPTGKYDPYSTTPTTPEPTPQTPTPIITRVPTITKFPTSYATPPTPKGGFISPTARPAPYIGVLPSTPITKEVSVTSSPLNYIFTNNRGLNSTRGTRYG